MLQLMSLLRFFYGYVIFPCSGSHCVSTHPLLDIWVVSTCGSCCLVLSVRILGATPLLPVAVIHSLSLPYGIALCDCITI